MIDPALRKQPAAPERHLHRELRIHQPAMDWSVTAGMNSVFVAGAEFGDVSREYPILFVRAGNDAQGQPQVAPIAALGLSPQENLYLLALHRNGVMALVYAQLLSMGKLRKLVQWRLAGPAADQGASAAPSAPAPS